MRSPCAKICTYDPTIGLCRGCGRTLDEIADWAAMTDDAREKLLAALPLRLAALKPAS